MAFSFRTHLRSLSLSFIGLFVAVQLHAAHYSQLKIVGQQRLTQQAIKHYLPFELHQNIQQQHLAAGLKALYQTGLFGYASFMKDGQTLILKVRENPTVSRVLVDGGETVGQDKILKVFAEKKLSSGMIFNPVTFHKMRSALINLYQEQGYHNVKVTMKTKRIPGNKVTLYITIVEGKEGKVQNITISGNHALSSAQLLNEMSLTPQLWSFLTGNNKFSEQAFESDLNSIRQLYYQSGYLQAEVLQHQAKWHGDDVDLTVVVREGRPFYFAKIDLKGPKQFRSMLQHELTPLKVGALYAHKTVHRVVAAIYEKLAAKGYAFVEVAPQIQLHPKTHQVDLLFQIKLGPKVMVRRIAFDGNLHTMDAVLRREMLQLEASQYNKTLISSSERNLNNLGYIKNAHCVPVKVGGRTDLIDLNCHLEEVPSTVASASVGYSSQAGIVYKVDFDQKNFIGTGRRITINAEKSDTVMSANFGFTDPHFLGSDRSNTFHIGGNKSKNVKGSSAKYQTNTASINNDIGIPVSSDAYLVVGAGFQRTKVVKFDQSYPYIKNFIDLHGSTFDTYDLHLGWKSSTYDRSIFPLSGTKQNVSAYVGLPVGNRSLTYYTLGYTASVYHPVFESGWTGQWVTQLGYGRGYGDFGKTLPFFKNYWAGGEGSLRGFETNTLGPKDSTGKPMGGNVLAVSTVNLFMPQWFGDTMRLGAFVDMGNVFKDKIETDQIRASAGIVLNWRTPMAPISLSLGYPIVKKAGDQRHPFSFSLSSSM